MPAADIRIETERLILRLPAPDDFAGWAAFMADEEATRWSEVIHTIAPDNLASQAVARKLGSRLRGPGRMPPPFQDVAVEIWGQTRAEWFARQQQESVA
ncbi:MAG TPA: GNAT family N-acetyltransferase [Rhodanobacteraceae bacterium]|nr:GNAT family N-acetyltransferase [Rhodanobacteraceae bacterium]